MSIRREILLWSTVLLLPLAVGCGGTSDQPELGEVTGVVTLDGEPLADARVVFSPVEGGQSSEATTDAQGKYALVYRGEQMGAKIGEHKVFVSTFEEAVLDDFGKPTGGREELVPEQYNRSSTLTVEVKPGDNEIPLDLNS
ncbi:hypothetical protein Mal4_05260 [Maioricimonas rarisocia]|uniref:Carboxypeptidase regulatory-like domain-containing protein n=1 Tax=Maioricimonas rarisocia TaxID=2528026 RepID=A0A517Z178_9PLAN|nr:carboxypeptidase-like regulatory domain-containing protein [Maioricimonas rarisocia]QDU36242.1 hypothetical protein Mal4_05260 [Maioricimonas rarisocia]